MCIELEYDVQGVLAVLKCGAVVDLVNQQGRTALHKCCVHNNVACARLLVQYGANVNIQDRDGMTPLHLAVAFGSRAVAELLLENHARTDIENSVGSRPLEMAESLQMRNALYHKAAAIQGTGSEFSSIVHSDSLVVG